MKTFAFLVVVVVGVFVGTVTGVPGKCLTKVLAGDKLKGWNGTLFAAGATDADVTDCPDDDTVTPPVEQQGCEVVLTRHPTKTQWITNSYECTVPAGPATIACDLAGDTLTCKYAKGAKDMKIPTTDAGYKAFIDGAVDDTGGDTTTAATGTNTGGPSAAGSITPTLTVVFLATLVSIVVASWSSSGMVNSASA